MNRAILDIALRLRHLFKYFVMRCANRITTRDDRLTFFILFDDAQFCRLIAYRLAFTLCRRLVVCQIRSNKLFEIEIKPFGRLRKRFASEPPKHHLTRL